MTGIARPPAALVAVAAALLVACGGAGPAPAQMAADVTRLQAILPVVGELRVADFEHGAHCSNLVYARGSFGHLEQEGCEREGTRAFDADALADHARLAEAIVATGVPVRRILATTFDADGRLETAWFVHAGARFPDTWEYLYDPHRTVPKRDEAGVREFTHVADAWWFVRTADD
jgi:hypothetical protein